MSRAVYEFSGDLVAVSALHVGTGDFAARNAVKSGKSNMGPPGVATVVVDAQGRPYLPPTTLKGLYRRLIEADGLDADGLDLVGEIKSQKKGSDDIDPGRKGALLARGASLSDSADVSAMPYVGPGSDDLPKGVFISARTRIDGVSGTAADSTLFFQEMVAAGAVFPIHILIEQRGKDAAPRAEALARRLAQALQHLTSDAGWAIGKGQADGLGRMRLHPNSVKVKRRILGKDGNFNEEKADRVWAESRAGATRAALRSEDIVLACDGPFLVMDASRASLWTSPEERRLREERGERQVQVQPQRLNKQLPLLLGTGISGALSQRATWLEGLRLLRAGLPVEAARRAGPSVGRASGALPQEPIDRLFGTTGFRGLLEIQGLAVDAATPATLTSVKLDRFTGGPVDGALFATDAFSGVRLRFTLRLAGRAGAAQPSPDDVDLFDRLVDDIRRNGLRLGHGTNKGFGWFTVQGSKA